MLFRHPGDDLVLLRELLLERGDLGLELGGPGRGGGRLECCGGVLEELLLSVVEQAGLKVVLFAELRDGDLVDVVAAEKSGLLLGGERSAGLAGHGLSRCRSYGGGGESHASAGAVQLYVGTEGWVLCYDVRSGDEAWAVDCGAQIVALDAHPGGVDVLAGARVLAFDPRGEAGPIVSVDPGEMHLRRVGAKRYIATPAAVYRLVAEERPALLYACRAHALHVREGGLQALVEGPPGTVLVEDDGLAMVWPFPDATTHLVAPWGRNEWAITPLTGRGGV